jgi:hypothetical protein
MIQTIDVAAISRATLAMLLANTSLAGVRIERAADPDSQPDYLGFIGMYRDNVQYPPRALGAGQGNRRQEVTLVFVVKMSNATSGEACEDELEALLQKLMTAILNDGSFGGTVDALGEDISVLYDSYDKVDSTYTQKAVVVVTGIVNVSAYS